MLTASLLVRRMAGGMRAAVRRLIAASPTAGSFLRAERGVAATEFALILPVMILLYAGAGEISQAAMTNRKMEALSRTLVDLISQQPTSSQKLSTPLPANATTSDALKEIFTSSLAVMAPAPLTSLQMTVSAVDIVNTSGGLCCDIKVRWSYTQSGQLRPCNVNLTPVSPTQKPSPSTISSAIMPSVVLLQSPISVLIADVSYVYSGPFSSQWIDFSKGMTRTTYMLPRTTGQVILASPITAAGQQSGVVCY